MSALDELKERLNHGELFCKATDIARLMNTDVAHIRGAAMHARESLPFASFAIGKNIKFSIPCVLKAIGEDEMTPQMIYTLFSDVLGKGAYCTPVDIAKIFGSDPNTVRRSLRKDPELFGFKVLATGKRIKVPVVPLIQSLTGAAAENIKAAIAAIFSAFAVRLLSCVATPRSVACSFQSVAPAQYRSLRQSYPTHSLPGRRYSYRNSVASR